MAARPRTFPARTSSSAPRPPGTPRPRRLGPRTAAAPPAHRTSCSPFQTCWSGNADHAEKKFRRQVDSGQLGRQGRAGPAARVSPGSHARRAAHRRGQRTETGPHSDVTLQRAAQECSPSVPPAAPWEGGQAPSSSWPDRGPSSGTARVARSNPMQPPLPLAGCRSLSLHTHSTCGLPPIPLHFFSASRESWIDRRGNGFLPVWDRNRQVEEGRGDGTVGKFDRDILRPDMARRRGTQPDRTRLLAKQSLPFRSWSGKHFSETAGSCIAINTTQCCWTGTPTGNQSIGGYNMGGRG